MSDRRLELVDEPLGSGDYEGRMTAQFWPDDTEYRVAIVGRRDRPDQADRPKRVDPIPVRTYQQDFVGATTTRFT